MVRLWTFAYQPASVGLQGGTGGTGQWGPCLEKQPHGGGADPATAVVGPGNAIYRLFGQFILSLKDYCENSRKYCTERCLV